MSEKNDDTEPTKNTADDDSMTKVYQKLHGDRTVVSIRCLPEIKEALKRFCKVNGVSICHIFEALVTGYLTGMKQKIEWVYQSPTINLTLVRDVKRVRRYAPVYAGEVSWDDVGSLVKCALCGEKPVARAVYYSSPTYCKRVFYCVRHWAEYKVKQDFQGYKML